MCKIFIIVCSLIFLLDEFSLYLKYVFAILNRCFGCEVIEGYGMTETSCVISGMNPGDSLTGHVGSPNPACGEFCFETGCIISSSMLNFSLSLISYIT